jgi:hypothetical protein
MYGLLALAVLGALGGIYGAGYRSGSNAVHNEWQTASREQRDREAKAGQKAAEKKEAGDQKAKIVYRKITQEVERVVEKPVYRNVCLDPDGLRIARDAISGKITDPAKPDESVRPPARTSGRESGLVIALDRGRF